MCVECDNLKNQLLKREERRISRKKKAHVVKRKKQPPQLQKHARTVQHKRRFLQRRPLDPPPLFAGRQSRPEHADRRQIRRERDEAEHADGPGKADPRQQLPRHGRIDEPTDGRAAGDDANGEALTLGKVGREQRQRRAELEAVGDADADALGEQGLPVGCVRLGGAEDADRLQGHAGGEDGPEVAGVERPPGHAADDEGEEELHAADPRD